jgi:hypothetical protein
MRIGSQESHCERLRATACCFTGLGNRTKTGGGVMAEITFNGVKTKVESIDFQDLSSLANLSGFNRIPKEAFECEFTWQGPCDTTDLFSEMLENKSTLTIAGESFAADIKDCGNGEFSMTFEPNEYERLCKLLGRGDI